MSPLEIAANAVTTLSIFLAARNHVATRWTGIVGCVLFGLLFYQSQLLADATLQALFLISSLWGWWYWRGAEATPRPIRRTGRGLLLGLVLAAGLLTWGYGSLLFHHTQAFMPYQDAAVMSLSLVAQGLLMTRRLETWAFWLLVNTLSVPLFWQRELHLTAVLYAAYWLNAWWGGWRWWREWRTMQEQQEQQGQGA
ncbi:MAG: nicotinamide riboside transporter PnuC [Ideonella sp.]|nr:nicotinamide riboside transporter PnuC [Ideonella sp.]